MTSKLFDDKVVRAKTRSERWIQLVPDTTGGYWLYEPLPELKLGRLLFDQEDNWIYDGDLLNVSEQEDVAAVITGCQREMDELLSSIKQL
ncbi:hypothetical protein [Mucilaginibacter rubeus]|uniref:Uncharacterized protein n=1 Tax=Mucilaginibacter rubeus TaxID=2027860 RepID=A0A5C1HT17_9SPHI|nr:hypothetical protein [Mucilaginibacter rubeus]QEM09167.1 hypothetical protein DEO27_003750 [Mucilaginibacter rubeus]